MASAKTKPQKLLCEPRVSIVTESKKVLKGSTCASAHICTHTHPEGVYQSGTEVN